MTSICTIRLLLFAALFSLQTVVSGVNSKEMMCPQSEFIERLRMQTEEMINEWLGRPVCSVNAERKLNNYEIAHLNA